MDNNDIINGYAGYYVFGNNLKYDSVIVCLSHIPKLTCLTTMTPTPCTSPPPFPARIPQLHHHHPDHIYTHITYITMTTPPPLPKFWLTVFTQCMLHQHIDTWTNRPLFYRRYFQLDICNGNHRTPLQVSLNVVPNGKIDNRSAIFEVMACHWKCDGPLPELVITLFIIEYMHHWDSLY